MAPPEESRTAPKTRARTRIVLPRLQQQMAPPGDSQRAAQLPERPDGRQQHSRDTRGTRSPADTLTAPLVSRPPVGEQIGGCGARRSIRKPLHTNQPQPLEIGDFHDTFMPYGVPQARLRHLVDCKNLSPDGILTSVVNHCHILAHEDTGMMYQLGVTPEGTGCSWDSVFTGDWDRFVQEMTGTSSPSAYPEWRAALERVHQAKARPLRKWGSRGLQPLRRNTGESER
ncbi:unnamed protein product [Polarella glacialis]|uniref:Uncharacterized protein n=1 Tax=Polarella glacialis TaxID=89957 RepID=A0A813DTF1_POLGL|nr:unnamed protein product [Polarella glacialis]